MQFTHGILAFDWVLVQFGNNLHSFHFQKVQIAFDVRAHAIEKSSWAHYFRIEHEVVWLPIQMRLKLQVLG